MSVYLVFFTNGLDITVECVKENKDDAETYVNSLNIWCKQHNPTIRYYFEEWEIE